MVSNTYLNWSEAEANCVTNGGHLATIKSSEENINFANSHNFYSPYMWMGLYFSGSNYVWVDNSTDSYRASFYSNMHNDTSYCVGTFYNYGNHAYSWRTVTCTTRMPSVCRVAGNIIIDITSI